MVALQFWIALQWVEITHWSFGPCRLQVNGQQEWFVDQWRWAASLQQSSCLINFLGMTSTKCDTCVLSISVYSNGWAHGICCRFGRWCCKSSCSYKGLQGRRARLSRNHSGIMRLCFLTSVLVVHQVVGAWQYVIYLGHACFAACICLPCNSHVPHEQWPKRWLLIPICYI